MLTWLAFLAAYLLAVVCHDIVYADDVRHKGQAPADAVRPCPVVALQKGGQGLSLS